MSEDATRGVGLPMKARFRVKLVIPAVGDTQFFYARTREEADEMIACFRAEVLSEVEGSV